MPARARAPLGPRVGLALAQDAGLLGLELRVGEHALLLQLRQLRQLVDRVLLRSSRGRGAEPALRRTERHGGRILLGDVDVLAEALPQDAPELLRVLCLRP